MPSLEPCETLSRGPLLRVLDSWQRKLWDNKHALSYGAASAVICYVATEIHLSSPSQFVFSVCSSELVIFFTFSSVFLFYSLGNFFRNFNLPILVISFSCPLIYNRTLLVAQTAKNLPAMQETWVQSLILEDPPEKRMATHSSILAWRILWTKKSGRLQSMGSRESDMTEWLSLYNSNSLEWHIVC